MSHPPTLDLFDLYAGPDSVGGGSSNNSSSMNSAPAAAAAAAALARPPLPPRALSTSELHNPEAMNHLGAALLEQIFACDSDSDGGLLMLGATPSAAGSIHSRRRSHAHTTARQHLPAPPPPAPLHRSMSSSTIPTTTSPLRGPPSPLRPQSAVLRPPSAPAYTAHRRSSTAYPAGAAVSAPLLASSAPTTPASVADSTSSPHSHPTQLHFREWPLATTGTQPAPIFPASDFKFSPQKQKLTGAVPTSTISSTFPPPGAAAAAAAPATMDMGDHCYLDLDQHDLTSAPALSDVERSALELSSASSDAAHPASEAGGASGRLLGAVPAVCTLPLSPAAGSKDAPVPRVASRAGSPTKKFIPHTVCLGEGVDKPCCCSPLHPLRKQPKKPKVYEPPKREINLVERQRRTTLRKQYDALRDVVPEIAHNDRASMGLVGAVNHGLLPPTTPFS